jgi:hypothetical protein
MRCREAERLSLARELGELAAAEPVELDRHLAACDRCRVQAAAGALAADALRALREEPPIEVDVRARVGTRIAGPRRPAQESVPPRQLAWASGFAVAGAALAAVLGVEDVFPLLGRSLGAAGSLLDAIGSALAPLGAAALAVAAVGLRLVSAVALALARSSPLLEHLAPMAYTGVVVVMTTMAATTALVVRRDLRRASRQVTQGLSGGTAGPGGPGAATS